MFERIRLITFDLDDTLWPTRPVIMAAEQGVHDWLAEKAPRIASALSVEDMREQRLEFMEAHPDIAHDLTQVRLQTLKSLMERYGYPSSLAVEGLAIFRRMRNRVQPWDDVLPVLGALKNHYILVSVTNGNAQLEYTPLKGCFHHSANAEQAGAAKPDPAMFEKVAQWSGVPFDEMMHVGDDAMRDVLPAKKLGMATAWVHRQKLQPGQVRQADLCLFNLFPLLVYLTP